MTQAHQPSINVIWTYWETLPGRDKPAHIELCHRTLLKNRGDDVAVNILGPEDIANLGLDLHPAWQNLKEPAHKADYLRVAILAKYGGFWLDSDSIILRPFTPIVKLLSSADLVGWEYRSGSDAEAVSYRLPLGAFGVQPSLKFMRDWQQEIHAFFDSGAHLGRDNWHAIGRNLMNPLLRHAAQSGELKYSAINADDTTTPYGPSNAWHFFEREPLSTVVHESPLQTHITYYNSWMSRIQPLSAERLLSGDELISRIFQYALLPERSAALLAQSRVPFRPSVSSIYLPINNFGHRIRRTLSLKKRLIALRKKLLK